MYVVRGHADQTPEHGTGKFTLLHVLRKNVDLCVFAPCAATSNLYALTRPADPTYCTE